MWLGAAAERAATWDVASEHAARRSEAVTWRRVSSLATFYSPVPLLARDILREQGTWLPDEADPVDSGGLVGFDAADRPVLVLRDGDRAQADTMWRWTEDLLEEAEFRGGEWTIAHFPRGDGRLLGRVAATERGEREVDAWTFEGDRLVRVERAEARDGGWGSSFARVAELGVDGQPSAIRSAAADGDYREDNRLKIDAVVPALRAGLQRAALLEPTNVVWDARVDRLVEPLPDDPMALAEPLARALDTAVTATVADANVLDPFCVVVEYDGDDVTKVLPPRVLVASRGFRDRMRASDEDDGAAIKYMWRGETLGEVARMDLRDRLDDAAVRACRALSTGLDHGSWAHNRAAAAVVDAVGDQLAAKLNSRDWPGASDPFIALVRLGDPCGDRHDTVEPALARAAAVLGRTEVDRFLASVASKAAIHNDVVSDELIARATVDRNALRDLVAAGGLQAHAERLAFEVAEVGLVLDATTGEARSRLGGPPLLPPGGDWPRAVGKRPLSFLAGVDLSELPAFDRRERFPAAGWLLFFAAIDNDDPDGLIDESGNGPDDPTRVLWVPPDVEPVAVEPPESLPNDLVLGHRLVTFRPVLTLPDGYDSGRSLGLDEYEARAYDSVVQRVLEAVYPGSSEEHGGSALQWFGGLVTGVQGDDPEEGTVLLLQLSDDDELGFNFLDAGAIQFRISADALQTGDFTRAVALADSC